MNTALRKARPGRTNAAFTLAEVVAALLFMAIVIPVAMEGLSIASRAGAVAARKNEAARIAERLLNETLILTNWSQAIQTGTVREGDQDYKWTLRNENWSEDAMQLLSLDLVYSVRGQDYNVRLSTLVPAQ
jgi:type II secretory pathway pseudopilin PulG